MEKETKDVKEQKNTKVEINKEKLKALQLTLDKIDKDYGKGTILKMGDRAIVQVPSISTGSIALDNALGIGGYPRGRVIEIFGPESSGKTTLAIMLLPRLKKRVALPHILMQNMLLTVYMPKN